MSDEQILKALTAACPSARPADEADAVAGVAPRFAASPASVEEASALLRAACERGLAMTPRGSGSKLDWGGPPQRCDLVVDTSQMNRVIEHAAGDLIVKAQAGVRLDRLAESLAGAGQQLALDPPLNPPLGANPPGANPPGANPPGAYPPGAGAPSPAGTIGGVLSTGVAGPRRLRYGTPRDLVIGITVVRSDGTVARSGGKVVKNVAGYDLGKLFAGCYGTLGLIAEAVVRLHPLPAASAFVTAEHPDAAAAHRAASAAAGSDLAPSAIEVDRPARGAPVRVGVLLEGDPAGVEERAGQMAGLLGPAAAVSPSAPRWWGRLGVAERPAADGRSGLAVRASTAPDAAAGRAAAEPGDAGGTLIRIAFWAAALVHVFSVADAAAAAAGVEPAVGGSAAAGVLYAALPAGADPAAVAAFVSGLRAALPEGVAAARPAGVPASALPPALGSAVVLHAPPRARKLIDPWGPAPSLELMRAVKRQFDPAGLMSPGRFAGGI